MEAFFVAWLENLQNAAMVGVCDTHKNTGHTMKQKEAAGQVEKKHVVGNLRDIANQMAREVVLALAEEVDEINSASHEFRLVMETTAFRVMSHLDQSSERIGVYEEALPGFTILAIKKAERIETKEEAREGVFKVSKGEGVTEKEGGNDESLGAKESAIDELNEAAAIAMSFLVKRFMVQKNQHVLSLEHRNVLVVLFPVVDTRKHLKLLGIPVKGWS
jgi:hypothetical protein